MASKVGSFFRKFFKLIFSLAGFVAAILGVAMMALPVTAVEISLKTGDTASFGVTGFGWAFAGEPYAAVNGELVDTSDIMSYLKMIGFQTNVDVNPGVLITVLLLIIGAVLALVYVLFSWGHRNASVKKGIGMVSALSLLVGGILCFLATNFTEWPVETDNLVLLEYVSGLGIGAFLSGIFAFLGTILMTVASLLGPKEK